MYYETRLEDDIKHAEDLSTLFTLQGIYESSYFKKIRNVHTTEEWLLMMTRALMHEICETEDEIKWKHWKQNKKMNIDKVKEEIIDQYIFIMNEINTTMDKDEFMQKLKKKMRLNVKRQREGYKE